MLHNADMSEVDFETFDRLARNDRFEAARYDWDLKGSLISAARRQRGLHSFNADFWSSPVRSKESADQCQDWDRITALIEGLSDAQCVRLAEALEVAQQLRDDECHRHQDVADGFRLLRRGLTRTSRAAA